MTKLRKLFLVMLGLPKTILFNLHYFPLATAVRLPVLVSHRVWLKELSGSVTLADLRTGAVRIGFGDVGIFDQQRSRTVWNVSGKVHFRGRAYLGHGSKISVTGTLSLGDGFTIAAESAIVADECIQIGDAVLVSWDVLIMDTDGHKIYDAGGAHANEALPITIGNDVWIGCRSLVLKGVEIADGVVVAAASTLTKPIERANVVAGGTPVRVIRENIRWQA